MEDYSRITGLASGMDTAGMIKQMLKVEHMKVDSFKAKRQRQVWKQESYREITAMIKGLESSYFDLLNKKSHLALASTYSRYDSIVKLGGQDTSIVSASIKGSADFDQIEINEIKQVATAETWTAAKTINTIEGNLDLDLIASENAALDEMSFTVKLDGVEKTLSVGGPANYASPEEFKANFVSSLNNVLELGFGEKAVEVTVDSGVISFTSNNHKLELVSHDFGAGMDVAAGSTNYIDMNSEISSALGVVSMFDFKISYVTQASDVEIEINPNDTISEAIKKINDGQSLVKIRQDSITGKFVMTSNKVGINGAVDVDNPETQAFLDALGLNQASKAAGAPHNAILTVNGVEINDEDNVLEIDGAKITLNKTHTGADPIVITKKFNSEKLAEKMKDFVKKYNDLIDKVNGKISERKNYKYDPLTEEQKKEMKEDDIKKWEEKAKEGLLRGDGGLERMLNELRRVFNTPVKGSSVSMKEIGIYFTGNWKDRGKIEFNEEKFNKALQEKGDDVVNLLTSTSSVDFDPATSEEKKQRFEEVGVMVRIQDVFKYTASTTTLRNNQKGYLVQKAGVKGTSSEFESEIGKELIKIDRRVDRMMDLLFKKEDYYYAQFAKLETALAQLQAQSDQFAGMM